MTTTQTKDVRPLDFEVEGMTCGPCAARVQKILSRQDGVVAADVNFATGRARVQAAPQVDVAALENAVAKIGYGLHAPAVEDHKAEDEAASQRAWLRRNLIAWPLSLI